MTSGVEVHQTIACWEEEFWITREGVPIDGFTSDPIPAFDGLPIVDWNIEGVFTRIPSRERPTSGRFVILQGQI
jgi:hypothetical protein